MTNFKPVFLLLIMVSSAWSFEKGSGSEFVMDSQGQKVNLNIYITDVAKHNMSVEFHFGTGGLMSMNMYQQFEMSLKGSSPVKVEKGYVLTAGSGEPEIMKEYMFHQNRGVQINDFLFASASEIDGSFKGDETVEIPAGSIIAKHYQKSANGQTVDFWISDQVKPIGLVKLVSKSDKEKFNNYTIELASLLQNVAAKIDPKKAVPMSKQTEEMLRDDRKK